MNLLFAILFASLISMNASAQAANDGLRSETIYTCADNTKRLEIEVRFQRGHWTVETGDQTYYILQRYVTTMKVDGKPATLLSESCRGAWRARAALCSAQADDVRYDLFRGLNFPLELSAIVWRGNKSSSVKVFCAKADSR